MLTDGRWQKLLQVMQSTGRIDNKPEHRMTFEGILFRLRTGIPRRDLPTEYGFIARSARLLSMLSLPFNMKRSSLCHWFSNGRLFSCRMA